MKTETTTPEPGHYPEGLLRRQLELAQATVANLPRDTSTSILVTWYGDHKQVLPYSIETLDFLVAHADGYERIEYVEVGIPRGSELGEEVES